MKRFITDESSGQPLEGTLIEYALGKRGKMNKRLCYVLHLILMTFPYLSNTTDES